MALDTIVKNKNLLIKVSFTDEQGISTCNGIEIQKAQGVNEKYVDDGNGKAKREGTDSSLKESLVELALREKRSFYKQLLQNQYKEIENIVVLSGAGSSVGIGKDKVKGLSMLELWDELEAGCLKTLIKESGYHGFDTEGNLIQEGLTKDLEALLSKAVMKNVVSPKTELGTAIEEARKFIVKKCSLELPDNAPHINFLNKITLRPQKFPRVKIFTLNYHSCPTKVTAKW